MPGKFKAHRHKVTLLRNPFLRCSECKKQVTGFVSSRNDPRSCKHVGALHPCGHNAEYQTVCATWTLEKGCVCKHPTSDHLSVTVDVNTEQLGISHRVHVDASDPHPPPHTRRRR